VPVTEEAFYVHAFADLVHLPKRLLHTSTSI
jgi:hypothetical protein